MDLDPDQLLELASAACADVAPAPGVPAPGPPGCMDRGSADERALERARRCAETSPQDPGPLRVLEVLGGPEDLERLTRAALVPGAGPAAAEALARLGGDDAVETLLNVACRADPTAAGWAMEALARFEDPRIDALLLAHVVGPGSRGEPDAQAARALGRRGGEAVWELLDRFPSGSTPYAFLTDPSGRGEERLLALPPNEAARLAVEEGDPRALELVERLARHAEPRFRALAGELAIRLGAEAARAIVPALLADPDSAVRGRVARELGGHRDGQLADLWRAAIDPADPDRAIAALWSARYGTWADRDEVDRRLLALADRWAAREALYTSDAVRGAYAAEIGALAIADAERPWFTPDPWTKPLAGVQNEVAQGLTASEQGRAVLEAIASDPFDPRASSAQTVLQPRSPPRAVESDPPPALPPPRPRQPTADARAVRRRALADHELGLLGVVGFAADESTLTRGLDDPATTRAALDGLLALGSVDRIEAACGSSVSRPDLRREACRALRRGQPARPEPLDAVVPAWDTVERLASRPYGRARLVALEPTLPSEVRAAVRRTLFTADWRGLRPPDAVVRWALDSPTDPQAIGFLLRLGDATLLERALEAHSVAPVIAALRPMSRPPESPPAPAVPLPPAGVGAVLGYLDRRFDWGLLEVAVQHPALRAELGRRLLDGAWPELPASKRGALLAGARQPLDADTAIRLASAEPHEVDWLVGPITDDPARVQAALLELAGSTGSPESAYRAYLAVAPDRDSARLVLLARPESGARYEALKDVERQLRSRTAGPVSSRVREAVVALHDSAEGTSGLTGVMLLVAPDRVVARIAARAPALTYDDLSVLVTLHRDDAAEVVATVLRRREDESVDDLVEAAALWLAEWGGPVAGRHWDEIRRVLAPGYAVVRP